MKAYVDAGVCVNCWACYDMVPRCFHPTGESVVEVDYFIPAELQDDVIEAAENCPVGAIVLDFS